MKGKAMKRLLALALTAASVMTAPGVLVTHAAENKTHAAAKAQEPAGQNEGRQAQPMEANGFISEDGEAAMVTSGTQDVSFGVVSDTHVTAAKATEQQRLAKAFQFYSDAGVDTMVVDGDLTDNGAKSEYDTWQAIKDENLKIPLIASMGNHENNSADRFTAATGNKPNDHKVINGYHFITLSPGSGTLDEETGKGSSQGGGNYTYAVEWLKKQLDAAVAEDPAKPVFVFFHHPIRDTFYVSNEWYGSGLDEIFKDYPQAVTFSGHIHSPNNMPTSIWQDGGYTAVNTVTLSYMEMEKGMIYGSVPPNASQIAQGLVVEAQGSKVTIKNYDFLAGQWIPQTWTFDVAEQLPYTDEREANAQAPYFEEDAVVTVSEIKDDSAKIEFTQAKVPENNVGDIVHSYRYDFVNIKTGEVVKTFKTWSDYYLQPMPGTMTQTAPDLDPGTSYEVRIYGIDAYQKVSENYISAQFTTTGEEDGAPGFDDMVTGVPKADLLDADFVGGNVSDHSGAGHEFYGSDGSNITMDEELGKETAVFTGSKSDAFLTKWTDEQYIKTNDGFTLETTFKVDKFSSNYVDLIGNMQGAGVGFELSQSSSDPDSALLEAWVHIGGYKKPAGTVKYGTWCHAAVTYDGSKVTLYINGNKVQSVPASGSVTTPEAASRAYVIGGDITSTGGVEAAMVGAVSAVRIYSEPLTAKQVYMLANSELPAIDTEKPQIQVSVKPKMDGVIGKEYKIPAAKAADNSTKATLKAVLTDASGTKLKVVGGESAEVEETVFIPEATGKYILQYIASDRSGNIETQSYTIMVTGGDRSQLDEVITQVLSIADWSIYTEESVAALMAQVERAGSITNASLQAEIDEVTNALKAAFEGLEEKGNVTKPDKTALQQAYEAVKDLTGEGYTEVSYVVFDAARTYAKEIIDLEGAKEEQIEDALHQLLEAKKGLISDNAMTYLKVVLEQAAEADRTNASQEAVEVLDTLTKEAQAMLDEGTADPQTMLTQAINILKAVGALDTTTVNFQGLHMAVQTAETLEESVYTEESWAAFAQALEEVKNTAGNPEAIQEDVENAMNLLGEAITGLTMKVTVAKEELTALIAKADAILLDSTKYTESSLEGLKAGRDAAQLVVENENASQEEVSEAVLKLQTALDSVVKKVDKAQLALVILKASSVNKSEYTEESIAALEAALANARSVYEDESVTDQSVVDHSVEVLNGALEALKRPDNSGNNGDGDNNDNGGDNNNNNGGNDNDNNAGGNNNNNGSGNSTNNNGSNDNNSSNNSSNDQNNSDNNNQNDGNNVTANKGNTGNTDKKDTSAGTTGKTAATGSKSVKTGDSANAAVPLALGVVSLAGIAAGIVLKKRR